MPKFVAGAPADTCVSASGAIETVVPEEAEPLIVTHADSSDVPSGPVTVVVTVCGEPAVDA